MFPELQLKKKNEKGDDEGVIHQKGKTKKTKKCNSNTAFKAQVNLEEKKQEQSHVADITVEDVPSINGTDVTTEANNTFLSDYQEIDTVVLE